MTAMKNLTISPKVKELLEQESQYCAGGFEPLPAFITKAKGSLIWDVDGKEYIDFIIMMSAVNTGHCHPYITQKVIDQYQEVALVNLAAHAAIWPDFAKKLCQRVGLEKVIGLTSGTEAADTAVKIARKWGMMRKGIDPSDCVVLGVGSSYHGLGQGTWGLMDPSPKRKNYGLDSSAQMNRNPSTGEPLAYLDLDAMKRCMQECHHRIAAVIMECLHGAARNVQNEIDYARGVYDLCKKYNVLFIADEVRQGVGKTGKFASFQHCGDDFKPDIVNLGKSITGGMYPQSFVIGSDDVLSVVGTFEVATSYGATPIAAAAGSAVLEVLDNENLLKRAEEIGELWRSLVNSWNSPHVDYVASIGADSNIFLKNEAITRRVAALCFHRGVYLFPLGKALRVSFALNIEDEILRRGANVIKSALEDFDKYGVIEGENWPY